VSSWRVHESRISLHLAIDRRSGHVPPGDHRPTGTWPTIGFDHRTVDRLDDEMASWKIAIDFVIN